jgi:hypothetical protein
MLIRSAHLVDAKTFSKVQGQPIFAEELENEILRVGWDENRVGWDEKQGDER